MSIIKCSQLGGPCDHEIEGDDPKEIFSRIFMHIKESTDPKHQELAVKMQNMSDDDCEKWNSMICNLCK